MAALILACTFRRLIHLRQERNSIIESIHLLLVSITTELSSPNYFRNVVALTLPFVEYFDHGFTYEWPLVKFKNPLPKTS